MNITAGIAIEIYYLVFLLYYMRLFPRQKIIFIRVLFSLLLIAVPHSIIFILNFQWLNIPVMILSMAVGIRVCAGMSFYQAVYGGGVCVLSLYCFRAIVTATQALILKNTFPQMVLDSQAYYTATITAVILGLIFFHIMRRTLLKDYDVQMFTKNEYIKGMFVYEWAAVPFFMLLNQGRFFAQHTEWFAGITLTGSLFTLIMLIYSVYHSIQAAKLMENEWNRYLLEEQLEMQIRHYHSFRKNTEDFRVFKHDHFALMRTLASLIEAGKYQESLEMIKEAETTVKELSQKHIEFSENSTLNAILQNIALICQENKIKYFLRVGVPKNTGLTRLEAVRIITNAATNAIEACKKVPEEKRYIEIISQSKQGWVTMTVRNSFNGEVLCKNNQYLTLKEEKSKHGLGLKSIQELAEKNGGFMRCRADKEKKVFELNVHVPLLTEVSKES